MSRKMPKRLVYYIEECKRLSKQYIQNAKKHLAEGDIYKAKDALRHAAIWECNWQGVREAWG